MNTHPPVRRGRLLTDNAWAWIDAALAGVALVIFITVCLHLSLLIGEHPFK